MKKKELIVFILAMVIFVAIVLGRIYPDNYIWDNISLFSALIIISLIEIIMPFKIAKSNKKIILYISPLMRTIMLIIFIILLCKQYISLYLIICILAIIDIIYNIIVLKNRNTYNYLFIIIVLILLYKVI